MFKSTLPEVVRQSRLASSLPRTELKQLDRIGTIVDVEESTQIIRQASFGRDCYIVVDGKLVALGEDFTSDIDDGEVAGELALLTGKPRKASVVAAADSQVYALHQREFATLLSTMPEFRRQILETSRRRLGSADVSLPAQFVETN